MAVITERDVIGEVDQPTLIRWGAIFAGLVFVMGISWLMFLLGSAIGVGVADATDLRAMGNGLGVGAIVWLLLTSIVAYFLGSMLTARLAGNPDRTVGMLHGVTLWSIGTALMVVLSYWGVAGLIQTGTSLVRTGAHTAASVGTMAANRATNVNTEELANSPFMATLQNELKRRASELIANSNATAGTNVSPQQVQQTIDKLDAKTLQSVASQLIQGDTEGAKATLASNANLSQENINGIINGVSGQVEQFKAETARRLESAAKYTQAALWAMFVSSVLGLIVTIIGGRLGAERVNRLFFMGSSRTTAA